MPDPSDKPFEVVSPDPFDRSPAGVEYWQEEVAIQDWIEAGAPSPMAMWLELQGKPAPPDDQPLTVRQAATREKVSERTIRRRIHELAAMEPPGAYKVGTRWRIVPAGLDALREKPQAGRTKAPKRRRPRRATSAPASTRWEV
jgi:hypothetical protein